MISYIIKPIIKLFTQYNTIEEKPNVLSEEEIEKINSYLPKWFLNEFVLTPQDYAILCLNPKVIAIKSNKEYRDYHSLGLGNKSIDLLNNNVYTEFKAGDFSK